MANVKLVLGYSCSGKEVYMRYIYEGNVLRISMEEFQEKEPPYQLIEVLDALLPNRRVVIEGYPLDYIAELREKHNIETYIITYAPLFILRQRRMWGHSGQPLKEVEALYIKLLKSVDCAKAVFFNSFENTHHKWTEAEFWAEWERINQLPTKIDEEAFLEKVSREKDDHYTPIVLPHYTYRGGTKTTNPQATWDKIKGMGVDVKGKRVIDIGCYEGYTLHLALEDGAVNALGLDAHQDRLRNAVKIAWLKQSPVNFLFFNINHNTVLFANDIILCLNMLHYTSPHIALPKIFRATREVVFEINNEQVQMVKRYAKEHGFVLAGETTCRIAREILWFTRR